MGVVALATRAASDEYLLAKAIPSQIKEDQGDDRHQAEQNADESGNALAALEREPNRKEVTEEGAECCNHGELRAQDVV